MANLTNSAKLIQKIEGLNVTEVGASAPSNPSEGTLWYDTTNDVLKSYDGTNWNATGKTYTAGQGIDITNDVISADTTVLATKEDLDNKQDTLIAGSNIQIAADGKTISATDTKYAAGNNITITGNIINARDTTYTAGTGISISSSNVISNTQTSAEWGNITGTLSDQTDLQKALDKLDKKQDKLIAGDNITIGDVCIASSDMMGPSPRGYHVPLTTECVALCRVLTSTFGLGSNGITLETYLKMPRGGYRRTNSNLDYIGSYGYYWSSTAYSTATQAYGVYFGQYSLYVQNPNYRTYGLPIRCFKDSPVVPDNSWTTLYDGSSVATGAGVFWNQSEGLISVSGNGATWYTIMDKNLGATTVYNQGDTYTDDNCGLLYQWGNNYGFPRSGTITTTYIQADASGYGPGDYYSSDTFITGDKNWSSVQNDNLRGGVSQGTWQDCDLVISADAPTKTSELTNDSNFQTDIQVSQSIAAAVASAYKYKGSVADYASLPSTGNVTGDVWNTTDTGMNYAWTGSAWDALGATIDLSNYLAKDNTTAFTPTGDYNPATKKYVDDGLSGKQGTLTAGNNITITNNVISATDTSNAISGNVDINDLGPNGLYYTSGNVTLSAGGSDTLSFPKGTLLILNEGDGSNRELTSFGYIYGTEEVSDIHCWIIDPAPDGGSTLVSDFSMYEINPNNFLGKYNTDAYTPTGNYNPATKKYVDDMVGDIETLLANI